MAMLPTVRTIISARPTRIVSGLVLIALSIWVFAPYVAYHVSSSAFINAEMMRVTAPISGYLSRDLPRKGKFIDHPERLALIKPVRPIAGICSTSRGNSPAPRDRRSSRKSSLAKSRRSIVSLPSACKPIGRE